MKIAYTNYLWHKLLKKRGFWANLGYFWANLGDLLVVFVSFVLRENKFKFWWWHLKSYWQLLWQKKTKI